MPKRKPAPAGATSRASARRTSGRSKSKKEEPPKKAATRATILPSQSVDHGTPPVILDGIVYPVLGDPVDLDPCSNTDSIVRARRALTIKENGLSVRWSGKIYVNPPYGDKEIRPFIEKIVAEYRHNGAEIIALLPAQVSAQWFDLVAATARAAFFWGPGDGGRRLRFLGNTESAAFHSVVAYWGPNLPLFTRHAIRFCHPWYPAYDLSLTRALLGDASGADGQTDMAVAEDLLTLNRHDDLAAALVALGGATLGSIMDYGRSALLHRLRSLSAYELASALVCSTRPGVHWLERRLPRTPSPHVPNQLTLPAAEPVRGPDESVDDAVLRHITAAGPEGIRVVDVVDALAIQAKEVQGALRRLRASEIVVKRGTGKKVIYARSGEEGHAPRQLT